jgi:DNA-binding MarR family transcriptional regulator
MAAETLSAAFLRVIPRALWAVRKEMRRAMEGRLTVPEFRVLGHLSLQPMSNKELAELQGVSVAAMSRMAAKLVRRGLLSSRAQATDRRRVRLEVSPKGQALFAQAKTRAAAAFEDRFRALSASERRSLAAGLAVLNDLFPTLFGA